MSATAIKLTRANAAQPWGFRIHGGRDFNQPLIILKVTSPSIASQCGLTPGDIILKINGSDASKLTHKQAEDNIKNAPNQVEFQVVKGGTSTWKPGMEAGPGGEVKWNLKKGGQQNSKPYMTKGGALVNKQFNSPIAMYSEQSIAETLSAQAEVLAGGAIGVNFKKNDKPYNFETSEVYKMLQEVENEPPGMEESSMVNLNSPAMNRIAAQGQAGTFKAPPLRPVATPQQFQQPQQQQQQFQQPPQQQQFQQPPQQQQQVYQQPQQEQQASPVVMQQMQPDFKPVTIPVKAPEALAQPQGQANPNANICAECERLIVGVFVRIASKGSLHVECFKCSTCGQSLKNVGYYNINNKLYCDIHAKLVAKQQNPDLVKGGMSPVATAPTGCPVAPPKPFSYTAPLPTLPQQQPQQFQPLSLGSPGIGGPLPFHHSPQSSPSLISHVTAPKSPGGGAAPAPMAKPLPLATQTIPPWQQNSSQSQSSQKQSSSSFYEESSFMSSSKTESFSESSGSKVTWPPAGGIGNEPSIGGGNVTIIPGNKQKFVQKHVPYQPVSSLLTMQQQGQGGYQGQQNYQQQQPQQNYQQQQFTPPQQQQCAPQQVPMTPITPLLASAPSAPAPSSWAPAPSMAPAPAPKPAPINVGGSFRNNQTNFGAGGKSSSSSILANRIGRGILNQGGGASRVAICGVCQTQIRGPFISTTTKFFCPGHFKCQTCSRDLIDIGFVDLNPHLHCEFCWESNIAPPCAKCNKRIKNECLKALGKEWHTNCFACKHCGKAFGREPFFVEDGHPYCQGDWNEMFTTKCHGCGFPIEAGDRWVEALNQNYHSQCFNCSACKKNLEGQSFFAKAGRPFCKSHAR